MTNPDPPARGMDGDERLEAAWNQLNLVLAFFSRIDTKISVVLGLDVGMLAVLFARSPNIREITMLQCAFAVPFFLAIVDSLWRLHGGSRPHLDGGTRSLVYFRTIAGMRESQFVDSCRRRSASELADDVLEQVWRNSKILADKFSALQRAQDTTLLASIPWLGLLALTAN